MSAFVLDDEAYLGLATLMAGRGDDFLGNLRHWPEELASKVRTHILFMAGGESLDAKVVTALWYANHNAVSGRYREPMPSTKKMQAFYNKIAKHIKQGIPQGVMATCSDPLLAQFYSCWDYQCSEDPALNPDVHLCMLALMGLFVKARLVASVSKPSLGWPPTTLTR